MADHAKHHDYHLVNPSPWPAVGATGAFITAVGLVIWMRSMGGGSGLFGMHGPTVFFAGVAFLLFTMLMWWRDVVKEAHGGDHTPVVQLHLRYGMILFIASEVMFFVAWFWAYFDAALFPAGIYPLDEAGKEVIGMVDRNTLTGGHWPPAPSDAFRGTFDPWGLPLVNTLILLTSGTTVTWAHHALLENNRNGLKWGLLLTIVLGVLFTACQAYEYAHAGFKYAGHIYGATFFMATGFHGAHVIIGTAFLTVCLFRALAGHFTPKQHFGFEAAAWYWHFVDVVWLFLFMCIYVWGAGTPAPH
jgi:cytochrome c oxidase subunit III